MGAGRFSLIIFCFFRANLIKLLPALNICPRNLLGNLIDIEISLHQCTFEVTVRKLVCLKKSVVTHHPWAQVSIPTLPTLCYSRVTEAHKNPFASNSSDNPQVTQFWMLFTLLLC